MKVEIKLLRPHAAFPKYGKDLDVGADIFLPEAVFLQPGMNKVPLGISVNIPQGFEGQLRPRGGGVLRGIAIHNPPIDPGYTGEIHAMVENITTEAIYCAGSERICQLVIAPFVRADFTDKIHNTRGDNGFNSTGK